MSKCNICNDKKCISFYDQEHKRQLTLCDKHYRMWQVKEEPLIIFITTQKAKEDTAQATLR